jgi:hypothetical protein
MQSSGESLDDYDILYTKENEYTLTKYDVWFYYYNQIICYMDKSILNLYVEDMQISDTRSLFKGMNIPSDEYKQIQTYHLYEYRIFRDMNNLVILNNDYDYIKSIGYPFLRGLYNIYGDKV